MDKLEYELETDLELTTIKRSHLIGRLPVSGRRDRSGNITRCVGGHGQRVQLVNAIDVEQVKKLADDLKLVSFGEVNESGVTEVEIGLFRRRTRIAADADRVVSAIETI